mmetsp:Transcript_6707/g.14665  ORF Transcript_6707/g.14665 Transcript_6707/m.14665 type:complete len:455 (+) Transcript_6707:159-1523(+)
MSAPPWPSDALKEYEPIRSLGEGGFGSVYLAKKRDVAEGETADVQVAMKMIGRGSATATRTRSESGYAKREVEILSELQHPRIVRLIDVFYGEGGRGDPVPRCIALSLARGPTLELMLKKGGALGLPMAREITRQLVDAIAYLHSRAVIHRDIKPDNTIISGAKPTADECYSDGIDGETAVKEKRWKLTLIDFGFARALKPSEIDTDAGLYKIVKNVPEPDVPEADSNKGLNAAVLASLEAPIDDGSLHGGSKGKSRGRRGTLDRSMSRQIVRDLSALGQRSYAAPEITRGVRQFSLGGSRHGRGGSAKKERGAPLAECVSDYGMVADAFSLGATIRYMLTGVPPHLAVDEFLAMQKSPVAVASKFVGKVTRKVTGKEKKRGKRYRSVEELPPEAGQLIHSLTHWDQTKRTTVRGAKLFPWICDPTEASNEEPKNTVRFLKCALPPSEEIHEPE